MRVIGTRRRPGADGQRRRDLPPERTDEVLAQSDFVLLLLPATPDTDNLIDAKRLAKMKPGAWLLNFGRGHLIKDDDLIAAAEGEEDRRRRARRLPPGAVAAEHPFWTTEGIIVLPHIGGPHPQRDTLRRAPVRRQSRPLPRRRAAQGDRRPRGGLLTLSERLIQTEEKATMAEFEKRLACVIAADGSIARGYMIDRCELVGANEYVIT